MAYWLLAPPVAFLIIFFFCWVLVGLLSRLAFRSHRGKDGSGEPYACGEENYNHMSQPDYSSFFPFAFFFTLAHVATLIMVSVPQQDMGTSAIIGLYIGGAVLSLYILFRK